MKIKSRKKPARAKAVRAVQLAKLETTADARAVVPLKERHLSFGQRWEYAPAPESFEYIKIPPQHELFIDGKFVAPHSGKYFDSLNPATEEKLTEIALADETDVALAVQAARRAYENVWSKLSGRERGKYIYRIARI